MGRWSDKVDHGLMTFVAGADDHKNLKHILEKGFHKIPNYSHWIYKNRSGRNNCIIWTDMDLGTMREQTLFVTDTDYNLINNIEEILIDYDDRAIEEERSTSLYEKNHKEEIENLSF